VSIVSFRRFADGLHLVVARNVMRLPSHLIRRSTLRYVLQMDIGRDSWLYSGTEIRMPWRITIGEGTIIGFDCVLDGRGGIHIGDHVNFSSNVQVWTRQHSLDSASFDAEEAPVVVEDYAWISARATLLPGVHVGRGAVVAAGSVVTSDVASGTVVGGVPAKLIATRPHFVPYSLGNPSYFV